MLYLHESPLRYHGSLCTLNCLIDSRWVVKLSDFGLHAFKKGMEDVPDMQTMAAKCLSIYFFLLNSFVFCLTIFSTTNIELLYRAPELLRSGPAHIVPGTQKGDIYSFGIVLYEIHTRHGPFGEAGINPVECLKKVLQPNDFAHPYRYIYLSFIFI